ncbi:MAG TPA: hypothetical protein VN654_12605 [Vicinamibacterales bacterium]|jgi:hypothetical protein|nr:hypothetical protein [Vicinamibacterales bacterium]
MEPFISLGIKEGAHVIAALLLSRRRGDLFNRTYDWIKARGLTEGGSDHAALVG